MEADAPLSILRDASLRDAPQDEGFVQFAIEQERLMPTANVITIEEHFWHPELAGSAPKNVAHLRWQRSRAAGAVISAR